MYYHVVRVGSRVDFRKKPAETPHAQHDTIYQMQVYQGLDDAGGASYFFGIYLGV